MLRVVLRAQCYAGVPERGDVERLADPLLLQDVGAKELVRGQVAHDPSLTDDHDPVDVPVEDVLEAVFDDDDSQVFFFQNAVDQGDGLFPGRRVEIGERLVKEQDLHVVRQDAAHGDALLLAAGEFAGGVVEQVLQVDDACDLVNALFQLLLRDRVILECEGEVLRHGEADELAVRVLQDGADEF